NEEQAAPYVFVRNRVRRTVMKKTISYLMSMLLAVVAICPSFAFAADNEKDASRLENSGTVLKEIIDVPDDIPQDLLDKADCVVVFPSVLKAAFIVGGSYGRGAMSCRKGQNFSGPPSARTPARSARTHKVDVRLQNTQ